MSFIRILRHNKPQIIKDVAFCELQHGILPESDTEFSELFGELDIKVREKDSKVSKDALNNAHGDWYEWLLAISAWNLACGSNSLHVPFLLPNIIQFDVCTLYEQRLYGLIEDLRQKVAEASTVQLITSNPDFVIINRALVTKIFGQIEPITLISPENLKTLENTYKRFVGMCTYDDIIGYISVKASFRPDRRLQISHEGSLMKALYAHLQTRDWIINPKGLKYVAISTKVNASDRNALKTVATHSLTTVFTKPQAAVDEVFQVNSLQQAEQAFSDILS